jgi:hypothetical protein
VLDAGFARHPPEERRLRAVGEHARGMLDKSRVHVVRRDGRADAIDMRDGHTWLPPNPRCRHVAGGSTSPHPVAAQIAPVALNRCTLALFGAQRRPRLKQS